MQLTVAQIARYAPLFGLFTFGNSWVYASGDRSMDIDKVQCLWRIITDPENATIEDVSTVLYGSADAHLAAGRADPALIRGEPTDPFTQTGGPNTSPDQRGNFVSISGTITDPNDTREWEDAKELARSARCTPADLDLAAGHVFGENTAVPTSAIISHRHGEIVGGVFDAASVQLPPGTGASTATNTAAPFSPREIENDRQEGGWGSGEEEETNDNADSDEAQPPAKRHRRVVGSDSDSDGAQFSSAEGERPFNIESNSGSEDEDEGDEW